MKDKIIKNKKYIIIGFVIILVLLLCFIFRRKEDKFVLNPIYNVYPEEVKQLYSNMVEVSCYGDWYLNIDVDNGKKIDIQEIDNNLLVDYVFSYMDKNNLLSNEIELEEFEDITKLLFYKELDLSDTLDNYMYGNYVYTKDNKIIVRTKKECVSNDYYVSHLNGYSFNDQMLSVDVNIGYLDDGVLYDMEDKKLGKYDGNLEKLSDMFITSPYYRFNYVNVGGNYKLDTVEFNIRY